ncbi:MAG: transcriptional repressor [Saprospiraceae bacterium]|jgi:Fur family ferric uptake transcriptional regulator|nr:transcriptional repressor [Saprospiraceae bacterium]MBL0024602.1 transcriptional repressor [Saprospiraceae bacterium]
MNDTLVKKFSNRDLKPTAMRILVLRFLMEQTKAISLSDLELAFERADKSTLFRTLKTFEQSKLVHSIEDGTGHLKYALCLEECNCSAVDLHYHFHCIKCKETYCLTNLNIPTIDLPKNFEMQQANMVVKGLCANCNH